MFYQNIMIFIELTTTLLDTCFVILHSISYFRQTELFIIRVFTKLKQSGDTKR